MIKEGNKQKGYMSKFSTFGITATQHSYMKFTNGITAQNEGYKGIINVN